MAANEYPDPFRNCFTEDMPNAFLYLGSNLLSDSQIFAVAQI